MKKERTKSSKSITSSKSNTKSIYREDYNQLIELLKKYREKRSLSQAELGMLIGQDQTFVSKYEKRIRRLDIIETLDICDTLEINLVTLIKEIREKNENR